MILFMCSTGQSVLQATTNLYFPLVFWAHLTLDKRMNGDDVKLKKWLS